MADLSLVGEDFFEDIAEESIITSIALDLSGLGEDLIQANAGYHSAAYAESHY